MSINPPSGRWRPGDFAGVLSSNVEPQVRNAYRPPNGFPSWEAAKARALAKIGIAVYMSEGASIGAGGSSLTDQVKQNYTELIAVDLTAQGYFRHGDTDLPTASSRFNNAVTYTVAPFTQDILPTGWYPIGPFWVPRWVTAGVSLATPQQHYTHPSSQRGYRGRYFRVWVWSYGNQDGGVNGAGSTFQYNLNGAAAQTFTHSATNDNFMRFFDIGPATPGWADIDNQVINFGNQSVGNAMAVVAISSYPDATGPRAYGIHYDHFAVAGSMNIGDMMDMSGFYPADKIARLMGPTGGVAPYVPDPLQSPPWLPHMVGIDIFDDVVAPGSTAIDPVRGMVFHAATNDGYIHGLRQHTQIFRRNPLGCDVWYHLPNFPDSVASDTNPASAGYQLENGMPLFGAIQQFAESHGQGWLSSDDEVGEFGGTMKVLTDPNPHPNILGHIKIKNDVKSKLKVA